MFDPKSRYSGLETYEVRDHRGRVVRVVQGADDPHEALLGYHLRREGQRLDHLAFRYLGDATLTWRICELAGAMLPESLTEVRQIPIPPKGR